MKKLQSYLLAVFAVLIIFSCKKKEVVSDNKNLGIGSYLTLVKVTNLKINYADLNNTSVSITVKEYGSAVEKVKIYVTKGQTNLDKTTWKYIKEVPYNGETALVVKATEMAAGLGIPATGLETGETYTLYNQIITKDGRTIDVTNEASSALSINSNYNGAMVWQAVVTCPFVGPVGGNYRVIRDDWQDWNPGDIVQVLDGPGANQINLRFVWPNAAYGSVVNPLIVNIDPTDGTATVPKTNFGDYGGGYNMTAQGSGTNSAAGYVFSCTGSVTLTMNLRADGPGGNGANFGANKLILKKL